MKPSGEVRRVLHECAWKESVMTCWLEKEKVWLQLPLTLVSRVTVSAQCSLRKHRQWVKNSNLQQHVQQKSFQTALQSAEKWLETTCCCHNLCSYDVKVKLWPKCNLGSFCECIWVKPSCKSIITMKEALLRFTVFSFSGQTHFQWECYGHNSIKISIFKTVRSLDTTWNFAGSITRVSTHEHQHWQHCLRTQSY